jgi:hypothetical protein
VKPASPAPLSSRPTTTSNDMTHTSRWNSETKIFALLVITGLVVSWVRQGLAHQFKWFASWGDFFISWFVHTVAVGVVAVLASAAILRANHFFVGSEPEEDYHKLMFYAVMTVLVAAILIVGSKWRPAFLEMIGIDVPSFGRLRLWM